MHLTLSLPEDKSGFSLCEDMFNEYSILIAGSTGSGKSVLIKNFIHHIIGNTFPFDENSEGLRFIFIDPQKNVLSEYKTMPHVMRYEYEYEGIRSTLDDVISGIKSRFAYTKTEGLKKYNKAHMVVIIDGLEDLLAMNAGEVTARLLRIMQVGETAKVHLICSIQPKAIKMIPKEIMKFFTCRIGLHCESDFESRLIIEKDGAERLPEKGKCIFVRSDGTTEYKGINMLNPKKYEKRIQHWRSQLGRTVMYGSYSEGSLSHKPVQNEKKYGKETEKTNEKNTKEIFRKYKKDYMEFCSKVDKFAKFFIPYVIIMYILFKYYYG